MKYIRHLLPLFGILFAMLLVLLTFYNSITKYEEESCWQDLKTTVEDISKEIQTKFNDEISKLHLLERLMKNGDIILTDDIDYLYLDEIQSEAMFTRIDVLYPDNTLIANGKKFEIDKDLDFDKIRNSGEYLTSRKINFLTGEPCVYYVLPVVEGKELLAVLIGVIDCRTLHDFFHPVIYHGEANVCIIDATNGDYIMDSWHAELGNVYEMAQRELLPDYEHVDFSSDIMNLKTGTIAFVSNSTGQNLYMYYAPLHIFRWEIAVFSTDDIIFANLFALKNRFIVAAIVEVLLLFLYFLWNIHLIKNLQQVNREVNEKQEKLEFLSYHDMLTGLYNRHKYFEMLSFYMRNKPSKIGVVYIDLNGLKIINDTDSHEAGDKYICTTADVLTKVFGENCYRIGGDEFVVVLPSTAQDEFNKKIDVLNEYVLQQKISLSIGTLWQADYDDINKMISIAEKEMYNKKRTYYQTLNKFKS